ncbi:MAG: hypothetical protein K0S30_982 [Clostridia bacterium]|jgi:hypothetical protein|nr:hypothetical protein [Clostridia bacterium]
MYDKLKIRLIKRKIKEIQKNLIKTVTLRGFAASIISDGIKQ